SCVRGSHSLRSVTKSTPGWPGAGDYVSQAADVSVEPAVPGRRPDDDPAGGENPECLGDPADPPRLPADRGQIGGGGVVAEEGAPLAPVAACRPEEPPGGEDRLVGVVDVAAAVGGPGRGHELHRALRSRDARLAHPPEVRLDVVHGCEHLPGD